MRFSFDPFLLISMISAFIYLLLLAGILLLLRKQITALYRAIRYRRRLSSPRTKRGENSGLLKHIDSMLCSVMRRPLSATTFLVLTIGLFFLVFTVSAGNLPFMPSAITGFAFCMLPYLFLRMKLERLRRKGSFEGENLVAAFLTHYWVSQGNVFETLERVVTQGEGIKITKKLLTDLLIEVRSTGSETRIRKATDAFAYSIGTNWSRMLAYNIRIAAASGIDISLSVEDILVQLKEARALAEERKRINGESVRMVVFLIPLLYVGSFFVSVGQLGLRPAEFLRNQFATAEGFGFFTIIAFLFLFNMVLLEMITNKKLDF
jgi:hypothetical protein